MYGHLEEIIMLKIVFGIILIIAALALIVVVLLQSGKDKSLSSAIAGSASSDTYYGKNKSKSIDKLLEKITAVVAIVFALIVLVSFIIQDNDDYNNVNSASTGTETTAAEVTTAEETTAADTEADPS